MSIHSPERFRVLCVEDEPDILRDIAEELAEHGFRVEQAANAEAAMAAIGRELPDLVVCDVQMPGMNGIELLEELRGRGDAQALVPFVFLTAFSDRETVLNGRRAGADDYLVKPVDYDLLIATVEAHLGNAAARTAAERERLRHGAAQTTQANVGDMTGRDEAGRDAAQAHIARGGGAIAVVKIEGLRDIERRFASHGRDHVARCIARITRSAGLHVFALHSHAWAVAGPDLAGLQRALEKLVTVRLREGGKAQGDRTNLRARIKVSAVVAGTMDTSGQTQDAAALLDRLMQSARLLQQDGGGRVLALDGQEMSDIRLASAIRAELVTALRQGQLHVCFQPKVDARSGEPTSAELLVRWESPLLGHLSPATFIPVVERAGLLSHLTDWVLRQAAIAQGALRRAGLGARLAVNIGASEFNESLPGRIACIFAEHGADESLLEVEVTETSMLADPQGAGAIVRALHERGIGVALDDFGTGYSSLTHLQACAIDTIKIDRSFVQRVAESGTDQKIVMGIIGLAKMLGVDTVAEGVELESQRRWLADHDCTALQGYVFSRPLRFEDYCRLLQGWPGALPAAHPVTSTP